MGSYEYKVVTAPTRGARAPGVKTVEGRFAHALEDVMNEMAAEGWEYQRAETLPSDERSPLGRAHTVYRNVLVFRRARAGDISAYDPRLLDAPEPAPALLPPPPEGFMDEEMLAPAADHGLSTLLKRRATRMFQSAPTPPSPDPWQDSREDDPGLDEFEDADTAYSARDDLAGFYGADTLEFSKRDEAPGLHRVLRRTAAE
ncbi:hypothetical protein OB2597_16295 [Pseudooceanicola batsensis HTCC2597]|uniref:DUF4177 domain-containing protein n=1 Tax=Pseudooceanicola batsensis (strain ATCC BAA-863 / DSM 15984 / KCTC 12145 / HTCC2597) TaxID=252305 RepID=A3TZE1_PSEBH|nr:DUF4177 domain-containing protein [Pseudooceanicola batsensis]EAQ02959.1 hypothetical protein OB2597_16295 [Pseudooceanicola batsensis HTCC2597]